MKDNKGYPPLLSWIVALPLFAAIFTEMIYLVITMFSSESEQLALFPSVGWFLLVEVLVAITLVAVYWVYEWCRRHEYWVQTTFQGHLVCIRPFGRMTKPVSPIEWVRETRISSLWAGHDFPMAQVGGLITNLFGVGTLLLGSTAYGPFYDFLTGWRNVPALQEIIRKVFVMSRGVTEEIRAAEGVASKKLYEGLGAGAVSQAPPSDTRLGPAVEAEIAKEGIFRAIEERFPRGPHVDLADYRTLLGPDLNGFSDYWDLETGDAKPPRKK